MAALVEEQTRFGFIVFYDGQDHKYHVVTPEKVTGNWLHFSGSRVEEHSFPSL